MAPYTYVADCGGVRAGVASGDPLPTSIVLWTRVTPRNLIRETSFTPVHSLPVFNTTYNVYSDSGLSKLVATGSKNATVETDYTVKGEFSLCRIFPHQRDKPDHTKVSANICVYRRHLS